MPDLDMAALAEELGVPFSWVKEKVAARQLPHRRYGKHVRFTAEDVAAIRAASAEPVAAAPPIRLVGRPGPPPGPLLPKPPRNPAPLPRPTPPPPPNPSKAVPA